MKNDLPIEASALSFIDLMPAEPVIDRATKQQKADANGEPVYSIELACIGGKGGDIINVKFVGTPPTGIRSGMPVKVTGLTITDWAIGDRFGLTFRAEKVEPLVGAGAGQKAGAA